MPPHIQEPRSGSAPNHGKVFPCIETSCVHANPRTPLQSDCILGHLLSHQGIHVETTSRPLSTGMLETHSICDVTNISLAISRDFLLRVPLHHGILYLRNHEVKKNMKSFTQQVPECSQLKMNRPGPRGSSLDISLCVFWRIDCYECSVYENKVSFRGQISLSSSVMCTFNP